MQDLRAGAVITVEERERIERDALRERERALLANDVIIRPGPYEAHVGFSNVCNMSCIMCWNGANPPPRKMSPDLLERIAEQVAPSLSTITPYDGSEPLIVSWDETRSMCERFSIDLTLTTNTQFLDARRFAELKDITETLFLSIDSHIPEVFEKIRPGSRPDAVFENLRATARSAQRAGLECKVNVVFMTENGPLLPDTIAYLADAGIESVHVMQMLDINGRSGWSNPLVQFSPAYLSLLKQRCIDACRRRSIELHWDVAGRERHDFRPQERHVPPKPRKEAYDRWGWRMKNHLPGFCRNVYDRLRIDTDGNVAPCSYSTDGELELGNLLETPFEEMWNGPRMQDLRRAHYTWDYPSICASCRFRDPAPPRTWLPFVEEVRRMLALRGRAEASIAALAPDHMTRTTDAPVLRFRHPGRVERMFVVLGLGGETAELEIWPVESDAAAGEVVEFAIPADTWRQLRPNVGWWWMVLAARPGEPRVVARSSELRCVIRHQPRPRIEGSGLNYPDGGHLPPVDLGSVESPRPVLGNRRSGDPWARIRRGRRHRAGGRA